MGEPAVVFGGGPVVGSGGVDFFDEIAEVVALVVGGYLGGPFATPLVPVDAFVLRGLVPDAAQVPAVLGECTQAQVGSAVVQAVVVYVVNDEMVGGAGDLAVHFDAPAVLIADGVAIPGGAFREPCVAAKAFVVGGVDDREQASGQGDRARYAASRCGGAGRVEIGAFAQERANDPTALGALSLLADQSGPAAACGVGREETIVTSSPFCHKNLPPVVKIWCDELFPIPKWPETELMSCIIRSISHVR